MTTKSVSISEAMDTLASSAIAKSAPAPIARSNFDRWCWERDISNVQAAGVLGCAIESVRRYRLPLDDENFRPPKVRTLILIEEWTAGEITSRDFERQRSPEAAQ